MHHARVVRTALLTALAAATVAATATVSATGGAALGTGSQSGSPSAASVYMDSTPYSAASVYIDAFTYRPEASMASVYIDSTVLPYAPKAAPPTTADCEAANNLACYTPDDLRSAYDLPALYARGATGKGETIMIVDAFGSPTIKADLA